MRFRVAFTAFVVIFVFTLNAFAQQPNADITITKHRRDLHTFMSNDYWIAFPQNFQDLGGKYIMLYVSSTDTTVAHVQVGAKIMAVSVTPQRPSTVNIPLSWELKSSGVAEDKAVHVWSDDAPLFVDYNSHNPYTSDASYVLPSAGWGRMYVVASYESLHMGGGGGNEDEPSEFVILANQDSTIISITPTADMRSTDPTTVAYPSGQTFTITLNAGQAVQYKAIQASGDGPYDLTGTRIIASNPIGVVGASQCPFIPMNYPYCDFICEMLQPVRTWGTTYYTSPMVTQPVLKKPTDTYLMIGTQPNQKIDRTDSNGVASYTITDAYGHFFIDDIGSSSRWHSDAPFLLMQYGHGAEYPDYQNGSGDPLMMAVNAVDNFSTPVIFNVLIAGGNQTPYNWSATIVGRSNVPVYFDGKQVTSKVFDDGNYTIYHVASLIPRQYRVESDSGVSVNVYGTSYDESAGYAASIGVSTVNSLDNEAPGIAANVLNPTTIQFHASDSAQNMSGLSTIELDTLQNMKVVKSNFVGGGAAQGDFELVVNDASAPAHAAVRVLDEAGNYSTIVKDYTPTEASVASPTMKPITESQALPPSLNDWLTNGSGAVRLTDPIPNPASNSTTLYYALRNSSEVNLELYDVLGNESLSLLHESETAGEHSFTIDTRLLPNGTYIVRAQCGNEIHSSRFVVAR